MWWTVSAVLSSPALSARPPSSICGAWGSTCDAVLDAKIVKIRSRLDGKYTRNTARERSTLAACVIHDVDMTAVSPVFCRFHAMSIVLAYIVSIYTHVSAAGCPGDGQFCRAGNGVCATWHSECRQRFLVDVRSLGGVSLICSLACR